MQVKFEQEYRCPCCGVRINAAANGKQAPTPKNGDFAVCAKCATVIRVKVDSDGVSLHELSDEDWFEIGCQKELERDIKAIQQIIRDGGIEMLIKKLSSKYIAISLLSPVSRRI